MVPSLSHLLSLWPSRRPPGAGLLPGGSRPQTPVPEAGRPLDLPQRKEILCSQELRGRRGPWHLPGDQHPSQEADGAARLTPVLPPCVPRNTRRTPSGISVSHELPTVPPAFPPRPGKRGQPPNTRNSSPGSREEQSAVMSPFPFSRQESQRDGQPARVTPWPATHASGRPFAALSPQLTIVET